MKKRIFTLLILAAVLCCCVICISACKPAYRGIEAHYSGEKEVEIGTTLDKSLFTVTAYYGNGTNRQVTDFELAYDFSTVGDKTVIVKYAEGKAMYSVTFTVTVVDPNVKPDTPALTHITAVYNGGDIYVGGALNNSDITVTAFYDGDVGSKTVTGFSVGNFSSAAAGECVVNVSYGENGVTKETTFTVNIVARATEVADYGDYGLLQKDGSVKIINTAAVGGELQIHFIAFENKTSGDSIYIKAGETDVLIDAGSTEGSSSTIEKYIDKYCTDKKLEYVIATHAHSDHISAFVGSYGTGGVDKKNGILDKYKCDNIITYAKRAGTNALSDNFAKKCQSQKDNGANVYTALECYNNQNGASRTYKLSDNVELEVLYNYYYDHSTSNENLNSVCVLINQYGDGYDFDNKNNPNNKFYANHYLFTGDLEASGEKRLVQYNSLPEVVLYKAGHHCSETASSDELLSVIKPKVVCACSCAGDQYKFPHQAAIDRISNYTQMLFITNMHPGSSAAFGLMNGNIRITSNSDGVFVNCSNNNTLFKDTDWFKQNRVCPPKWKNETEQSITA